MLYKDMRAAERLNPSSKARLASLNTNRFMTMDAARRRSECILEDD